MTGLCFRTVPGRDKHAAVLSFHSLEASEPAIQAHEGVNSETREAARIAPFYWT